MDVERDGNDKIIHEVEKPCNYIGFEVRHGLWLPGDEARSRAQEAGLSSPIDRIPVTDSP